MEIQNPSISTEKKLALTNLIDDICGQNPNIFIFICPLVFTSYSKGRLLEGAANLIFFYIKPTLLKYLNNYLSGNLHFH